MRALFLLLLATSSAFANEAAILRCRELADPAQRFACYESIVVTAPATTPPRQTPEQFGLRRQEPARKELETIESTIAGRFQGWGPKDRIQLANGQIWQVTDDSRRAFDAINPKVTIRRGTLGSFFLEIEGINHTPRVRRVQ